MFISINPKCIEINDTQFKWQTISESATTISFKKPAAFITPIYCVDSACFRKQDSDYRLYL